VDKKVSERFPHSCRIVRSVEYRAMYDHGEKIHSENFVLFYSPNEIGHPRLGITVSRKIGCAIVRNRAKRLFREIFRRSLNDIPENLDFVVNAKSGCALIGYQDLRDEFMGAARKAGCTEFSKGSKTHASPLSKKSQP
jgi:ribonuclease P protein component